MRQPDLRKIDKLVRPVVKEIYNKGYCTKVSCEGHDFGKIKASIRGQNVQLQSMPYIVVENRPELKRALRSAGFKISKFPVYGKMVDKAWVIATVDKLPSEKQRKILWKKAVGEIKKVVI